MSNLSDHIRQKILTGDAYPSFMAWLKKGGENPSSLGGSVNVAAGVGATRSGWIGLNLYVMCPSRDLAEKVIPAFLAVLQRFGFEATVDAAFAMLEKTRTVQEAEEHELWPKELPPLQVNGVRSVKTSARRG